MGHMRISSTEPLVSEKLRSDAPKVPNQAKAKRDGVINPQNYNFNTNILYALKRLRICIKSAYFIIIPLQYRRVF